MADYAPEELPHFDSWRTDCPPVAEPCRICREWTEDGSICSRCADEIDELDDLADDE